MDSVEQYMLGDTLYFDRYEDQPQDVKIPVSVQVLLNGKPHVIAQAVSSEKLGNATLLEARSPLCEELRNLEISSNEARAFQDLLGRKDKQEYRRGELGKLLKVGYNPLPDISIEATGKTLSGPEQNAITLYTTHHYLLINGTLDADETSLKMWKDKCARNEPDQDALLKAAQSYVPKIARAAASGLSKLPKFQGLLFRGDSMKPEEIAQWKEQKSTLLYVSKFFSCSTAADTSEEFAKQSTINYKTVSGEHRVPVLCVFVSQSAVDIAAYSSKPQEDERVFSPGQVFRLIELDQASYPGLTVAYFSEEAS